MPPPGRPTPPRARVPSAGAAGTCSSAASSARSTTAPTSGSNRPRSTTIPSSSTRRLNPRRARHICAPSSPAAAASRSTPRQPRTSRSTCSAVAPHATASSRASVNGRAALIWLRSASAAVTRSFSRAAPRSRPVRQLRQWAQSGSLPSRAGGRVPASHTNMVHAVSDGAVRGRGGLGSLVRRMFSGHIGGRGRFSARYAACAGVFCVDWRGAEVGSENRVKLDCFGGALRTGVCCGNCQSRTLGRGKGVSVRKRSHRPA